MTGSPSIGPKIVSVSRRTDIPAYFGKWFLQRIREGYVDVPNPFNRRLAKVSLLPEAVKGFVFWTRNPHPFLPHVMPLISEGYPMIWHVTITGLPRSLEKNIPDSGFVIDSLKTLRNWIPQSALVWRFDPVIPEDGFSGDGIRKRFLSLAEPLSNLTDRVMMSFVDGYRKTLRNYPEARALPDFRSEEARNFLDWVDRETPFAGRVSLCTEPELESWGYRGACIRWEDFGRAWPNRQVAQTRTGPTRMGCGCSESVDIGVYDTCLGGCRYCYAVLDHQKVRQKIRNEGSSVLSGPFPDREGD